ncbi:MAG: amidase family protein [Candidatus Caldarchaeum sp.]|nr:amidase family protein [Candidatus Caldarchaeum sp.]MDW8359244.1 amidase family protein [Candidatus Caldarchaeum sp.]
METERFRHASLFDDCVKPVMFSEAAAVHDELLRQNEKDCGPAVRNAIRVGRSFSAIDYLKALERRHEARREILKMLEKHHGFVCPTTPTTALKISEAEEAGFEQYMKLTAYTLLFNLAGLPAVSIPAGLDSNGLPVGVQIAGRLFDESRVLRLAHQAMQRF